MITNRKQMVDADKVTERLTIDLLHTPGEQARSRGKQDTILTLHLVPLTLTL